MARVRSIIDRGYDTTLADFLDKLPQFFLQQQQLKDARDERNKDRQFQQTQYLNQLEQQRKNNEYRQSEANYRKTQDNLKLVLDTVNNAPFGQRYSTFKNLVTNNSDFASANVGNLESMYKKDNELFKNYQQINDKYDEINETLPLGQFERYDSMVDIRDDLKNLQGSISDANLKTTVDNQINNITKQIKFLESNAGKKYSDDQIPDNKMNALRNLRGRQQSTYNDLDTIKNNLLKYSKYVPPTRDDKGNLVTKETYEMLPFPGKQRLEEMQDEIDMSNLLSSLTPENAAEWKNEYDTLMRQYTVKKNQYNTDTFRLNNFYKDNNLIYPQLNIDKDKTTEDPKGTETDDVTALLEKPKTTINTNAKTITEKEAKAGLNNSEIGMQILGYLFEPDDDNIITVKDGIIQDKEFFERINLVNNLSDDARQVVTIKNNNEEDGIPEAWKIGAGTNQIALDDKERETIVDNEFDPAQDFVEDEDKISPILSPITAGTRSETADRDPSQYKKDIDISTIMPELITPESLNQLNLKDEKGNQINFNSSVRKIDNQLNSMYKKIDNISKQLKQTSSSREEKELMKSNAMEIINNLLNALEASKMEAKNVKEKNIKATVSSFLKNKNTSIDKLKKYYNTLF